MAQCRRHQSGDTRYSEVAAHDPGDLAQVAKVVDMDVMRWAMRLSVPDSRYLKRENSQELHVKDKESVDGITVDEDACVAHKQSALADKWRRRNMRARARHVVDSTPVVISDEGLCRRASQLSCPLTATAVRAQPDADCQPDWRAIQPSSYCISNEENLWFIIEFKEDKI